MALSRVLLIQTAALLLTSPSAVTGSSEELKNRLTQAKGVLLFEFSNDHLPIQLKDVGVNLDVIEAKQTEEVFAAVKTELMGPWTLLCVYTKDFRSDELDESTETEINYLPYDNDKAVFMRLDPNRGGWFITAQLSGCDVWIVDVPGDQPLLVHINANKIQDKAVDNLKYKESLASKIVNELVDIVEFNVIRRISYDYASEADDNQQGIEAYWKNFENKYKIIPVTLYEVNAKAPVVLYGIYTDAQWTFILKTGPEEKVVGSIKVQMVDSCNINKGSHCQTD